MVDYKANGDIVGAMTTVADSRVCVILVYNGGQYVVSRYRSGENDWFNGRYFTDNATALAEFNRQCQHWCVS